jgi:hypothetical protein
MTAIPPVETYRLGLTVRGKEHTLTVKVFPNYDVSRGGYVARTFMPDGAAVLGHGATLALAFVDLASWVVESTHFAEHDSLDHWADVVKGNVPEKTAAPAAGHNREQLEARVRFLESRLRECLAHIDRLEARLPMENAEDAYLYKESIAFGERIASCLTDDRLKAEIAAAASSPASKAILRLGMRSADENKARPPSSAGEAS